jgi:hypothetical protein
VDDGHEEMTVKNGNLLAVLVVLSIAAGCSNHTQQVPAGAGVTFLSPAPTSHTVLEVPGQKVSSPARALTERANADLLPVIAAAWDDDKEEFCQDSQAANCDKDYMQAFHFRKVTLNKSGQMGLLVEFVGADFCGSAGCAVNVLKQTGDKLEKTFEYDEVGSLDSFEFATTVTNGFYDLMKLGGDGTDYNFSWTGSRYEDVASGPSDR